jgi:hypothetical protein
MQSGTKYLTGFFIFLTSVFNFLLQVFKITSISTKDIGILIVYIIMRPFEPLSFN